MTRMHHEHIKDRWLARLASEVAGDATGEGARTRRRGFATHPGLATGRAQLGEGGRASGRRRYPGVAWRPLASRPAPQGAGKMVVWGVAPVVAESVAVFLLPRRAETHVQSVSGAVVSPGGRTGRPGRSAPPQLKPHLAWQSLHKAPYQKLAMRNRNVNFSLISS